MTVTCQVEKFADVVHEIAQLVDPHWQEVGSYRENFDRSIDYGAYHKLEREGRLLTITARDDGELVGYIVGVLGIDLHRVTKDDPPRRVGVFSHLVYYMIPEKRGYARSLIRAAEEAAEVRGVQIVNTRIKPGANRADAFFAKIGYTTVEVTMTRLIGDAANARSRAKVA